MKVPKTAMYVTVVVYEAEGRTMAGHAKEYSETFKVDEADIVDPHTFDLSDFDLVGRKKEERDIFYFKRKNGLLEELQEKSTE